jgi:3-phenylpropionate/trans-cinnamate dioxygenase ferredoxin reductase subunit
VKDIIVIGAGQAGASICAKLRQTGFNGKLSLFGDEKYLPYQRPPLSKKYLLGEIDLERLYIRPQKFYSDYEINLILSTQISKINTSEKLVYYGNQSSNYDHLAFTTGSTPRKLPKEITRGLKNIFYIRSIDDVNYMASLLAKGKKALIIGGGYIGLEAAAVCRKLEVNVTLIEMSDRILNRVSSPETADYFRKVHRDNGVKILESTTLKSFIGDKEVTGAILQDGSKVSADIIIVGIGIQPNDSLASNAGIEIENGIKTNSFGQTSNENIWAAGDCASFLLDKNYIRLESVQNAIDQAEVVAENMLGSNKAYNPSPWFWSDQYNIKLQIAGLNIGYDQVIVRNNIKDMNLSHWYFRLGKLISVDAINDPRSYMIGKRIIESDRLVSPKNISDINYDLKKLLHS